MTCAALVCLTVVAYFPALRAGFVFDDDTYVTRNALVQSPGGLRDIWFRPSALPQYYPLTFTTFWIEYRLWGLSAAGYHVVNILLHASNAILLFVLLLRLKVPGPWLAAAVFAVHPVNVESVAWIVERKNVLSMLFYLLASLTYLRFAGISGDGRPSGSRSYLAAMLCLACSLLAKSITATWPFAILVLLWWRNGRLTIRDVLPLIPAVAMVVASGLATWWIEKNQVGARGPEFAWTLADSWIIAGRSIWFYAGKLLWPFGLCFVYPRWDIDAGRVVLHLFPAAAVAVILVLWLLRGRMGRGPIAAVLLFVGTLGPALGLVKVYAMRYSFVADHWVYHAGPALIVLVIAAVARMVGRARWSVAASRVAAGAVLAVLTVLTARQAGHYRNIETFWRAALNRNPNAWMASNNLGQYLLSQKRFAEAERYLTEAVRAKPDNFVAMTNLGVAFFGQNRPDEAIERYRAALAVNPDYVLARNHLGVALFQKGQLDGAIRELQRAVDLRPNYVPARQHLAMALELRGSFEQAIAQYEAALALAPDSTLVCNNLAWLLATVPDARLRNGPRALDLARRACRATEWKEPAMLGTLSAAFAEGGDFDTARQVVERAHELARAMGRTEAFGQLENMRRSYERKEPFRIGPSPRSMPASSRPAGDG